MNLILASAIGILVGLGLYLMMSTSWVRIVIGFGLFSHAVNLIVFSSGGLVRFITPIIPVDSTTLSSTSADPVPQALVLTAIVIGFGAQVFLLALFRMAYQSGRFENPDHLREDG